MIFFGKYYIIRRLLKGICCIDICRIEQISQLRDVSRRKMLLPIAILCIRQYQLRHKLRGLLSRDCLQLSDFPQIAT